MMDKCDKQIQKERQFLQYNQVFQVCLKYEIK